MAPSVDLPIGTAVEALYNGQKGGTEWYTGKIHRANPDGTFAVLYDDGDREFEVLADHIRRIPVTRQHEHFHRGASVVVFGQSGGTSGVIEASDMHSAHFDIRMANGAVRQRVPLAELQPALSSQQLQGGARIEARFEGGATFFPGRISHLHGDGHYDVAYDDGDSESRVHWSMIRFSGGEPTGSDAEASVGQKLQQLVTTAAARGVDIVQSFQHFDKDNSGGISRSELATGMEQLGIHASGAELDYLMRQLDTSGNGQVLIQEFARLLPTPAAGRQPQHNHAAAVELKLQELVVTAATRGVDIVQSFQHFDKDSSGTLTRAELSQGLAQLGLRATGGELDWLMRRLDADGDGSVRIEEFARLLPSVQAAQEQQSYALSVGQKLQELVIKADEQGVDIVQSFQHFDKDSSGTLTRAELSQGLAQLGLRATGGELDWLMRRLDADGDGSVRIEEFARLLPAKSLAVQLQKLVREANSRGVDVVQSFEHFDSNKDGSVTRAEFSAGLTKLGFTFSEREMLDVLNALDSDRSGDISIAEFKRLMPESPRGATSGGSSVELDTMLHQIRELVKSAGEKGADVRESFEHFDRNFDGVITAQELGSGLQELGFHPSPQQIQLLAANFGGGDMKIRYHGFLQMLEAGAHYQPPVHQQSEVETVLVRLRALVAEAQSKGVSFEDSFQHFDANKDGKVSRSEFFEGLQKLGFHNITAREARLVMRRFENPDTHAIAYREFVAMVSSDGLIEGLLAELRQLVATAAARGHDVRESFEHFDRNFDGAITRAELCEGLSQ